jgi:hypothetical protein
MANKKKTITSLGDVLAKFESALSKEAATEEADAVVKEAEKEEDAAAEASEDVEDKGEGAESSDEESAGSEDKDDEDTEKVASTDTIAALRQIAKTASQNEETAMVKEAEAFGQAMARGFIAELSKVAEEQALMDAAYENGYDAVVEKLAADEAEGMYESAMDALGDVVHESYVMTRAKLAAEGNAAAQADIDAELEKFAAEVETAGQAGLLAITKEAYDIVAAHLAATGKKDE